MCSWRWMSKLLLVGLMLESHVLWAQESTANVKDASIITLQAIGEVTQATGLVKAIGLDNKERVLKAKSPLFPKEFIITAKDSYAGLHFTDGTLVVLRPLTAIQVNQYKFADAELKNDNQFKLNLDTGGISVSPGVIGRTAFGAFLVTTPISEIKPAGQKDAIAYLPNKGVAFIGMGKIRTPKGTKNVTQVAAITIDKLTQLPVQVSVIPALLSDKAEATVEQTFKNTMTTYGEAAAFTTTAIYNAAITPAQLSEEAVVASLNVDDAGNVTVAQTATNALDDDDDLQRPGDYAETSDDDGEAW